MYVSVIVYVFVVTVYVFAMVYVFVIENERWACFGLALS